MCNYAQLWNEACPNSGAKVSRGHGAEPITRDELSMVWEVLLRLADRHFIFSSPKRNRIVEKQTLSTCHFGFIPHLLFQWMVIMHRRGWAS
jgi:hypothetical protein